MLFAKQESPNMPDKLIKILFIGDIVGKPGRKAVKELLPSLKKEHQVDLTIANAENLAHGIGVTKKTLNDGLNAGIDFFTSGNHIFGKPEANQLLDNIETPLLRPANYPDQSPGQGEKTLLVGEKSLLVINLNGQVFINDDTGFSCPFKKLDQILDKYKKTDLDGIIVDFHAEATSEKVAFGWYADGRVSAVLGTHTHIVTADEQILPQGTAYITDIGMAGLKDSVIGIDKENIINKFLSKKPISHEIANTGRCLLNAVLVTINPKTNKSSSIKRIYKEITI